MIVPSEGWSRAFRTDILPGVRGKLLKALARSMRRAALLTTLSLMGALAIGVGGFVASSGTHHALASVLPASADTSATHESYAAEVPPGAAVLEPAVAVAVSEQPFGASRAAVPAAESPVGGTSEDVVRASRLVAPGTGTPELRIGDRVRATVSFYYCELGSTSPSAGDGGGFCGAMRDGSVVYNGAAACDYAYLGQRFRIEGDPLRRIYRCADTGSAVHGLHRDIWFNSSDEGWKWQKLVGQSATIEIIP